MIVVGASVTGPTRRATFGGGLRGNSNEIYSAFFVNGFFLALISQPYRLHRPFGS